MSTIESINTFKQLGSVRVAANSNQSGTYFNGATNNGVGATFTYATGALVIDGVTLALNDQVLFAGQTLGFQNGIYQVTQAGATGVSAILTRRGDFQCREQIKGGQYCPVAAGTALGGSIWTLVEPFPNDIGVPTVSGANNIVFNNSGSESSGVFLPLAGGTMTGAIVADKGTATSTAGAATINHQSGVVTTEALTTAAASAYSFTLTNSAITTSSVVMVGLMGGTNTTRGIEVRAIPGNGTATISFFNNNVAASALNGTLIFGFNVL